VTFILQVNPIEKIEKLIGETNYKAAVAVANDYKLEVDWIHKRHWEQRLEDSNEVETHLLDSITDKRWVFEQCTNRIPNTVHAIRALIQYGISQTSYLNKDALDREMESLLDEIENSSESLQIGSNNSLASIDIYFIRKKLLARLDFLSTFEVLCGDAAFSSRIEKGESIETLFGEFVNVDVMDFAMSMAQAGNLHTLEVLFTRHGQKLLPYMLAILDQLPALLDPSKYAVILPRIDVHSGLEELWREIPWRRNEWTSDPGLDELTSLLRETATSPRTLPAINYPVDVAQIASWYLRRIEYLEKECGLDSYALNLANIARTNGVSELRLVIRRLELSCYLVYESTQNLIEIDDLLLLPDMEALSYFLHTLDPVTICDDILHFAIPFLSLRKFGSIELTDELESLYMYFIDRSSNCEDFMWLQSIVEGSTVKLIDNLKIIPSFQKLQSLCINCAYSAREMHDFDIWENIVDILERHEVDSSSPSSGWDDLELDEDMLNPQASNSRLEKLRIHLNACRIFRDHGFNRSLSWVTELFQSKDEQALMIKQFPRKSELIASVNASDDAWNRVLTDLLDLKAQNLFPLFSTKDILESVATFALGEARNTALKLGFTFASSLLFPQDSLPPIPMDKITKIIINSAKEFADNASNCNKESGYLKNAILWY
jgi:Secretory pathway protein Sec39